MKIKVRVYNEEGVFTHYRTEDSNYEIPEGVRESFDKGGFVEPIWDTTTNGLIESATQEEIAKQDIEYLEREIRYETNNLIRGAKRIVLNDPEGELSELDDKIFRLDLVYKWAKGELTSSDTYIDIDAKRAKVLIDINAGRDAANQLSQEYYKKILTLEGNRMNKLLITYEVMINDALEKVERLKENGDLPEAKEGMTLIKNVSKIASASEAAALLTQILDL